MRIKIPADLPADPGEAYRCGWRDRAAAGARIAGATASRAKARAARRNGAKGGRPKKKD